MYRQSPLGAVDPSFRALSGRLKFTVRRHKLNEDSVSSAGGDARARAHHPARERGLLRLMTALESDSLKRVRPRV